jgi:hypothetical protein
MGGPKGSPMKEVIEEAVERYWLMIKRKKHMKPKTMKRENVEEGHGSKREEDDEGEEGGEKGIGSV